MFGGTFNPPHLGHISAARAVCEALRLDRVIFMPTNIPPHKQLPEGSATPQQRLEMASIAASMVPMGEVSDIEIEREGASYTVDTLRQLRQLYPGSRLWIIIGTDMLDSFEQWYKPEEIAALCRIAVVARDKDDRQRIKKQAVQLAKKLNAVIDIVDNIPLPMSSTGFRNGASGAAVPSEIKRYIKKHRLYGYQP